MAQTIIVDISTRGANPVAYTHQGDTGRTFFAEIYENGEAFAVAGYTIKVGAILPADRGYTVIAGNDMVTATKTNDNTTNKIYFTLSDKYSLKAGNGILTLIFTSNTGTPSTIRPINIDLRIQKSADADDTIAGASDFPEGLEAIAEEVFQEYLSTYLPPVAPSSSAAANKAADAKLTGEALDDLKSDLSAVNDLLSFLDIKRETYATVKGHNIIATGISLQNGKTYIARWTLSEAVSATSYGYILDSNNQNIFTGTTAILAGNTVLEKKIIPSQDYDNLTAEIYTDPAAPSVKCTFELYSYTNYFTEVKKKADALKITSYSELKNMLPFLVGSLNDGVPSTSYKYRISSSENLVFDADVVVKLTDGYRGGYVVFQNIEDTTTTEWHGWSNEFTIPANTIFKLQLARPNNQETTGGTISDPYDNDIMDHLTIYATKAESYDFSAVEYGHRGLKCEQFMDYALWSQGVARVEDTLVGFKASNDDHTNTATYTSMHFRNGYHYNARGNHNLGHCASADYCNETDALIVANGTYAEGVVPTVYLINNAKTKTDEGDDILVTDSDVIEFDLSSLTGGGCVACFGETSDIMYVITTEDASNYSQYGGKYLYKIFLGKGSANMTTLHPNESVGTFISGKGDNEYNGTAYIIKEYYGEYFIELQGMKYVNGRIVISCDKQVDGVLTAYIMLFKTNDDDAIFEADNVYWIPSLDSNGAYVRTESEGVAFDGGYGYVTILRSTLNDSKTLKFSLFD